MGKAKLNIPMCAALVLLMLTMISIHMTSGLYARYVSSASGEDSARVAKFDVSVSDAYGQTVSVPIQPGEEAEKYFTVTNKSEVAVSLKFAVTSKYSNLPLQFLHEVSAAVAPGETKNVPLLITWPAAESDDKYIGMVDLLEISVQVVQVD